MKQKKAHLSPLDLVLQRLDTSARRLSLDLGKGESTVGIWRNRGGKIPDRDGNYEAIIKLAAARQKKITIEELARGGTP